MITALEICTNPLDLHITITQEKPEAKFAIGIYRGPGHNFKPMITSTPFARTAEEALNSIQNVLETAKEAMMKEFADRKSIPSRYLNPATQEIDPSRVLTSELITQILDELRKNLVANTYTMFASAS